LINKNIKVYNWKKKKLYDIDSFKEEYQLLPKNYIFQKIIRGDSGDEIKGIKTIGEKTFERIFIPELSTNENINELGDFLEFIKNIDKNKLEKKDVKHFDLLQESNIQKELILKFQLMKLSESYLSLHHLELLKQQIEEQKNKSFSKMTATILMMKDSFNKLYGVDAPKFKTETWLQPFHYLDNSLDIKI